MHLGVNVVIDDPDKLEDIRRREIEITTERIKKILDAGANVIFTTKGIDDLCLKCFVEANAMAVRRCKKDDLKRIAKATGGKVFYFLICQPRLFLVWLISKEMKPLNLLSSVTPKKLFKSESLMTNVSLSREPRLLLLLQSFSVVPTTLCLTKWNDLYTIVCALSNGLLRAMLSFLEVARWKLPCPFTSKILLLLWYDVFC